MKLNDYCDKVVAQLEYDSFIGSLMYVMHCTRPNIALLYASYQDIQASRIHLIGRLFQECLVI
jgi:hypothetical protein